MDDSELRTALKDDHEACFGWAVICCRGDRELAEDVLQSVYVSVLERRAVFRGESGFRTWLFGVIRNVARDTRRGRWWSRMVRLDFESIQATRAETEQNEVDERDQNLVVRKALEQLPVRQREIIHLVFLEKLTLAEAARVMNVTTGTASQHYARGKTALQQQLKPLWNARLEQKSE